MRLFYLFSLYTSSLEEIEGLIFVLVCPPVIFLRNQEKVRVRLLKFYVWYVHENSVDPYFSPSDLLLQNHYSIFSISPLQVSEKKINREVLGLSRWYLVYR